MSFCQNPEIILRQRSNKCNSTCGNAELVICTSTSTENSLESWVNHYKASY